MALSVPSSNGGPGLSSLLRQARQVKTEEAGPNGPAEPPATVSLRPASRSGIDSTQRGTAQMSAALTVYMSKLGGADRDGPAAAKTTAAPAATGNAGRSGAADLLRTLDAYRSPVALRLTA